MYSNIISGISLVSYSEFHELWVKGLSLFYLDSNFYFNNLYKYGRIGANDFRHTLHLAQYRYIL